MKFIPMQPTNSKGQEELKRGISSRQEFLADVSHELKHPIFAASSLFTP
jgi:signal transduction histidine kinase